MRPTLRGCWKWSMVVAEYRTSLTGHGPTDQCWSGLGGQPGRAPGLHTAFEIEDMLHAQSSRHLGGDCAALANFAHEDDVVCRDHVFGARNDLTQWCQGGIRNVIAGVLPVFAHVDDGQLAARNAIADLPWTEPAEWLGRRLTLIHKLAPSCSPVAHRIPMPVARSRERSQSTLKLRESPLVGRGRDSLRS